MKAVSMTLDIRRQRLSIFSVPFFTTFPLRPGTIANSSAFLKEKWMVGSYSPIFENPCKERFCVTEAIVVGPHTRMIFKSLIPSAEMDLSVPGVDEGRRVLSGCRRGRRDRIFWKERQAPPYC